MEKAVYKKFVREETVGPPPPEQGNGGSFRVYFQEKKRKLHHQFAKQQGNQRQDSQIFEGVRIHVNGHTVPSHQELRQLMALHGGTFVTYYNRSQVTHFICNNLPDVKLKQMQHERNPVPVVRSEWIVASIQAGRLLPIKDFLLNRIRDAPGQHTLTGFNSHQIEKLLPGEKYPILAGNGDGFYSRAPCIREDAHCGPLGMVADMGRSENIWGEEDAPVPSNQLTQVNEEYMADLEGTELDHDEDANLPEMVLESIKQDQSLISHHPLILQGSWNNPDNIHDDQLDISEDLENPCEQDTTDRKGLESICRQEEDSSWAEARQVAASKRAACNILKGPPQTSRAGPTFMETYFKASRLHFIGTWRARIESLTASMINTAPKPLKDGTYGRVIVHLDMDCFFASAAAVGKPVLRGKPIVVCHSNSENGTGEVSAANYEARAFGIRSGSCIAKARKLCPSLIVVPYEFEKYQSISEKVYKIALSFTGAVQPISCDEAFLDITGLGNPEEAVKAIRHKIHEETECTASAGIGPNLLLARLATKKGKPNGQFQVHAEDAQEFVSGLALRDFHGVGRSLQGKLASVDIVTVADLLKHSKDSLQRAVGQKTGQVLFEYARGQDEREVEIPKPRRSIGAECNWGIRFDGLEDTRKFLRQLSQEVSNRLMAAGVRGRSFNLKVKRRRQGAPEPSKFLGCGICDSLSRSVTISGFTNCGKEIYSATWGMLAALGIPAPEIRGVGIVVSRFDTDATSIAAKVSLGAVPSRAKAPPALHVYDRKKPHPWVKIPDDADSKPLSEKLMLCNPEKPKDYKPPNINCNLPAALSKRSAARDPAVGDQCVDKSQAATEDAPEGAKDEVHPRIPDCDLPTTIALPPASQIDHEVWDALPLLTRREIEHEYEVQRTMGQPRTVHRRKKRGRKLNMQPRETTKNRDHAGDCAADCTENRQAWFNIRYSQLDPVVLAELPDSIRQEVMNDLRRVVPMNPDPSTAPMAAGLPLHKSDPDSHIQKGRGDAHGPQLEHNAVEKSIYTDSSQMMKRLQEIEQKLCSMAEESLHSSDNLTDIQQELYVLLTSLNPMSDGISQALRFIRNLGRKLPQFKNASTAISTSVLEYMEQNHGVRVNIMNPLFDI